MKQVLKIIFIFTFFTGAQMNCDDVTGDWINVKNSTMRITQDANSGLLTGGYLTAVQANTGDAGKLINYDNTTFYR